MKILISSSYKFIDKWDDVKKTLEEKGYECTTPKDIDLELFGKYEDLTKEETKIAHKRYFDDLDKCDILLVLNYNGYLGKSMLIEIGYAKAAGKLIYAIEDSDEPVVKMFITKIVQPDAIEALTMN